VNMSFGKAGGKSSETQDGLFPRARALSPKNAGAIQL
jgi:hypothetical protein